jgi:hypothetical protein
MSLVRINWRPDSTELRKFGLAMLVGFGLIGTLFHFGLNRTEVALVCWIFGAVAGVLGLTGWKAALPLYWTWMGIAFVLGNIMSRVVLTLFYYGMITPMGLCRRLAGRDRLKLRKPATSTYWIDVALRTDPNQLDHQF